MFRGGPSVCVGKQAVLCLVLVQLCSISSADDREPILSANEACSNITGEYMFWGTFDVNGQEKPISFLQRLIRPSRVGVRWVRITQVSGVGEFAISFLDDEDRTIGKDIHLVSHCVSGKWEEMYSFEGNSDGTLVRGTRLWRYSRSEQGTLVVEYLGISSSQYFPGMTSYNKAQNRASFLQR